MEVGGKGGVDSVGSGRVVVGVVGPVMWGVFLLMRASSHLKITAGWNPTLKIIRRDIILELSTAWASIKHNFSESRVVGRGGA